jgi:agmatinase
VFDWQRERGITSLFMHDVHERGIAEIVRDAVAIVGAGPAFVSIDIDVLDPAFAPGTGTPEPGGMTSAELLRACRALAGELEIVGADVVEVSPTRMGASDITALVAARTVQELLTGIATAKAAVAAGFAPGSTLRARG